MTLLVEAKGLPAGRQVGRRIKIEGISAIGTKDLLHFSIMPTAFICIVTVFLPTYRS